MNRAARFAWVGVGGFALQGMVLHALAAAGLPYLLATAVGVEAAILHNFLWHERWTWGDRAAEGEAGLKGCSYARLSRFLRFNGSTAVISIGGNLSLMAVFVGWLHLPLLPGNLLAVVTLSVLNFLSADRVVFATKLTNRQSNPTSM